MAYLQRDNGNVYFEDHGTGETCVILVHGWGMNVRVWDATLVDLVDAGYRVVAMDHRGCGNSDKDFDDMGISAIAGDVGALIEHLGLGQVVLNGWSLGGAVVIEAASRFSDKVKAVVLTCGASPIYVQKPDLALGGSAEDVAATVAALNSDRVVTLSAVAGAVCAMPVDPCLVQWMWLVFCEASPRAAVTLGQLADLDQREMLGGLTQPILSFIGEKDTFVAPEICRWAAENYSNIQSVEFEGCGHAPFIEVRERYLDELKTFLAAV
ncbi:MAG: alpha/beta fold hydrolase [Congregibacter sp.]